MPALSSRVMLLAELLLVMMIARALLHGVQHISLRHHACLFRPWRNRLIDLGAGTSSQQDIEQDMIQTISPGYESQAERTAMCCCALQVAASWPAIWSVLLVLCANATVLAACHSLQNA